MTTIKEVRAAIDAGLDRLQARAEAAAAQLNLSEDEIDARVAEYEDQLKAAAVALQERMAEGELVAGETKTKVQSALEHLQVQLALGKADTRDAFNAKKRRFGVQSLNSMPNLMQQMRLKSGRWQQNLMRLSKPMSNKPQP